MNLLIKYLHQRIILCLIYGSYNSRKFWKKVISLLAAESKDRDSFCFFASWFSLNYAMIFFAKNLQLILFLKDCKKSKNKWPSDKSWKHFKILRKIVSLKVMLIIFKNILLKHYISSEVTNSMLCQYIYQRDGFPLVLSSIFFQ